MPCHLAAARRRSAAVLIAVVCALCCLGSVAAAQNACRPKDEIFGGYAWLAPNGWGDLDYKINNIPNAFDASNTYYLPNAPNFGLLLDGSGHFHGGTTPPNLDNGANNATGVGYALGGFQYKYHRDTLSPFFRAFLGAASISPDCCGGNQWNFAVGGGGGVDLSVTPRFSIRLGQADYIYSNYNHRFQSTHPTQWNSVRLAAGVVFSLGSYCEMPLSCKIAATPSPTEVFAGEPVKLTATGTNFNVKHPVDYKWTSTGGRLSSAATEATEIDTTGLAPGNYSIVATLTDPKLKKMNSATCSTAFVVKPTPVPPPPTVSCAPKSSTVKVGQPATITLAVENPGNLPLTYAWSTTAGQLAGSGSSATLTPSDNEAGHTVTVTATVTDDRSRIAKDSCEVVVPALPPPCVTPVEKDKCNFKQRGRPARVDNDCKDVLDGVATALQQRPGNRLVIVGYADPSEAASNPNIAAQRAENVKYYLTVDGSTKIDTDRIETRQGGNEGKLARFYFIPAGDVCPPPPDLGRPVDETKVGGHPAQPPRRPPHTKATTKTPPEQ